MAEVAVPRLAATVVLLREAEGAPEIFMVKRSARASFMGGAYVFPGGRVDASDALLKERIGVRPEEIARLGFGPDGYSNALAIYAAALRETFEEANISAFARDAADAPEPLPYASPQSEDLREATPELRQRLQRGEAAALGEFLEKHKLYLDARGLVYLARWVTPEAEPKRFDTYFFMAAAPSDQEAAHDQKETTEGAWLSAKEALARHERGEIFLAPPTFRTLENLARFATVAEALAATREAPVPVVRPVLRFLDDNGVELLLDGDIDHPNRTEGPFIEGPSRIVLREGRWWSRSGGQGA